MTFKKFAKRFETESGWLGDVADDVANDSKFPRRIDDQKKLSRYLDKVGARDEAIRAATVLMSIYLLKKTDGSLYD